MIIFSLTITRSTIKGSKVHLFNHCKLDLDKTKCVMMSLNHL